MVQLQKPKYLYFAGKIRPWDEGVLHVSCEAVTRGLNCYEGLKGYWQENGVAFGIVAMHQHYSRLLRSAKLLHIPCHVSYEEFEAACQELVTALYEPDQDMWVRATLYVVEGHWGEGTRADLVLTAYHQPKDRPSPISIGVSSWRRSSDVSLPPRIKTSTNYQVARLARIEGRPRGHGEMILLNQWGRVAEATGSCVVMVRDGLVVTPPATEGRLESITIEILIGLCRSMAIPVMERPVDRTELYVADELALIGTLAEIVPVNRVDEHELPTQTPILNRIADRFWSAVRGIEPSPVVILTIF